MKVDTSNRWSGAVRRVGAWLAISIATAGCKDDSTSDAADGFGYDAGTTQDAGGLDARASDADVQAGAEGGLSDMDATSALDASDSAMIVLDATTETSDSGAGDASADASGFALTNLEALQVGRFGGDLRAEVAAAGAAYDVVAVQMELLSSQRASLGTAQVPLAGPISGGQGSGYALWKAAFARYADVAFVRVTLVDDLSGRSAPQEVAITTQTIVAEGQACDPTLVANRCADGLGCKGAPTTCQAGEAPALTRVGYFVDALGPRILIEGMDPDLDANGFREQFFDADGNALAIDVDNDDATPAVMEYTGTIPDQTESGFFVVLTPSQDLIDQVASISVVAVDDADHTSAPMTAMRMPAPERGAEATCDARSFNRCPDGSVCANMGDQYRCAVIGDARNTACDGALVLDPSHGTTSVRGALRASLWEPPAGCVQGQDVTNQPDRVVKFVLPNQAARVVFSTDHPYTSASTQLYLLASCGEMPRSAWCEKDATLTLTDLAPNDYYVVVDSYPSMDTTGDTFELTVVVE